MRLTMSTIFGYQAINPILSTKKTQMQLMNISYILWKNMLNHAHSLIYGTVEYARAHNQHHLVFILQSDVS